MYDEDVCVCVYVMCSMRFFSLVSLFFFTPGVKISLLRTKRVKNENSLKKTPLGTIAGLKEEKGWRKALLQKLSGVKL